VGATTRIDAGLARKAVELLRAQRLPAEPVLARVGLDAAALSRRGGRIPFAAHVAILEDAAAAARDPCFGLHLGAALRPRDLGLVGYLGLNAATLGDALRGAARYLRLFTEGTRVEVEAAGELVRVTQHILDPAGVGSRQVAGLGVSGLVRVARILTGTMLAPAWVELPFASCDEAEHRRVLGASVRLDQPRTVVVLERRQLALRTVGADPDLFDLLEQVCRERVGALADPQDPRARAEAVILELLPYGAPSLDRVARRLGTSGRSLGRRLAAQGTSFKALVDDLRRELARRYLAIGAHRPKAIAALLGYQDVVAFHHAFRRWTGMTPTQFREDPGTPFSPAPARSVGTGGGAGHAVEDRPRGGEHHKAWAVR
jgi:AraC-like DNA-binding protein